MAQFSAAHGWSRQVPLVAYVFSSCQRLLYKRRQPIWLTNNLRLVDPEPQPRAEQLAGGSKIKVAFAGGVVKQRCATLAVDQAAAP